MSKRLDKPESWEEVDKKGFVLPKENKEGKEKKCFCQMDNLVIRQIMYLSDMQTAMLYLVILSHRNDKTNECFPSISTLARECFISPSGIKKKLKVLHDIGALKINSGCQGVSNNYYFPFELFYDEQNDYKQEMSYRKKSVFKKKNYLNKDTNEVVQLTQEEYDNLSEEEKVSLIF